MSTWTLAAINQTRYLNDIKRALVLWLRHHLADTSQDFYKLFTRVGNGVDVYAKWADFPAQASLSKPRLMLGDHEEEQHNTVIAGTGHTYMGAYVYMTFPVLAVTDHDTGYSIACDDLAGAVAQIVQTHYDDLESIGLVILPYHVGATREEKIGERPYWQNEGELKLIYTLKGKQLA